MAHPPSEVDGPFLFFKDYDLPGHDAAYLPNLKGNIDSLKAVVLDNPGSLFCGFNTNGSIKACDRFDYSMLVQSRGSTFYTRVQYPGWHFVQGQDSPGNDIERITDVTDPIAVIDRIAELWKDDDSNDRVAAFNTNGWVKHSITFPLKRMASPASPLDGFYIRTDFRDFNFFPHADSSRHNIRHTRHTNDIPSIIRACKAEPCCAGFNTNGWLKRIINIPPSFKSSFHLPWQGTFVRTIWPDFVFLPGVDSPGNDVRHLTRRELYELLQAARVDSKVVALNTDGWLKSAVNNEPSLWPDSQRATRAGPNEFSGLYVKATHDNPHTFLDLMRFALLSTGNTFALWFIKDAKVRGEYSGAVRAASNEILSRVQSGTITARQGAEEAIEMRNTLLYRMRSRTSRFGLSFAEAMKPTGGTLDAYFNRYSQRIYGKNYADLTQAEAEAVALSAVDSAGRANANVTKFMKGLAITGKAFLAVSIACAIYFVVIADDWKGEVVNQVGWWSGAIAGGEVGVGVGSVFGPVGAILGGIAGGILGGLGASSLANWFYGAVTGRAAADILFEVALFKPTRGHVQDRLMSSGKGFYVHLILNAHLDMVRSGAAPSSVALQMVEAEIIAPVATESIYATIVWVKVGEDLWPTNAANPKDMVTLLQWVARNLPN